MLSPLFSLSFSVSFSAVFGWVESVVTGFKWWVVSVVAGFGVGRLGVAFSVIREKSSRRGKKF